MNAFASLPSYEPNSDSDNELDGQGEPSPVPGDRIDPSIGKGCAEALVKRGLVDAGDQSYVAALITQVANDAVSATRELVRQAMIEHGNEAVVAEFIRRTVKRRAWGIERPVAVGRLAQNVHQRRQAATLQARRHESARNNQSPNA